MQPRNIRSTFIRVAYLVVTLLAVVVSTAWPATFYSQGSLAPSLTTSWNSIRAGGGSAPANFTAGDVFVIQNGHGMTTVAAWSVSGTGAKIQIESGGTLTANHIVAVPTFQIDNGGSYVHAAASGTTNGSASDLPGSTTRSFGASSTVEIQKWANGGGTPVALPNIAWGNLVINVATLGGSWNQAGALQTVNGNLTIQATGGGTRQFQLASGSTVTLNISGNYSQSGGVIAMASSNNANVTINSTGFAMTGGTFSVAEANNITSTVNLTGDYSQTAGTIIDDGNHGATFVFKKTGTQAVTSGGTISGAISFTVNSGATLSLGTSVITGSGAFTLSSGAGIGVGSAAGITTSGATGNVQCTGSRSYSSGANYTYNGAAAQVTGNGLPATVNDLTINDAAGVSLTGSVAVNGALSLTNGTLSIGANTLTLNAGATAATGVLSSAATGLVSYAQPSAGQPVLPGSYGNLTLSNFNKVLSPTGTIGIAGVFTPGTATGHTITGSTIQFNGSGSQTIPAFAYAGLSSSGSAPRTLASSGVIKIAGAFSPGSSTYTISGSTIEFNGSAAQAIPSTFTVFNHLTINDAAGVTLGANTTVNGTLALTSGVVTTGSNTLIVAATGSVSRNTGFVAGALRKTAATGATTLDFEIGSNGTYSPASVTFANVTGSGTLTASTTSADHPNLATSGLASNKSLNRFWTITNGGVAFTTYSATFNFVSGDLDAGANAANLVVRKFDSPNWIAPAVGTRTSTSVQATGLNSFSDFALGEPQTYTLTASAGANGAVTPSGAVIAPAGGSQTFSIAAGDHYHVLDVKVDGISVGAVASYTFSNVTTDHTIGASFAIDSHLITASAGAHGAISPSGATSVNHGADATFSITPDAHYHVVDVLVDGTSVGAIPGYTFNNVTTDHTIAASFAIDTHVITATAGAHGAISPSGPTSVNHGDDASFAITPDAHYHIVDVLVDGTSIGAVASHTFSNVTADHTIEASFAIDIHVITATAGAHGTITPSGAVSINHGDDATFAIVPDAHYHVADIVVDGTSIGAVASHTFSNVTADHTIEASFAIDTHVITATAGAHGTISPSGALSVNHGDDATFAITADAHYHVVDVLVDGTSIGAVASHAFSNVTEDHTIEASFAIDTHIITATAGAHGSISPSGALSINHGDDATLAITADAHYHVVDVLVDGTSIGAVASHTFTNVTGDHTIGASFAIDAHIITATAGAHGSISPTSAVSVNHGDGATFAITPDAHYHIIDVLVDGSSIGVAASHTFSNVTADHTIEASFAIDTHVITATAGAHGTIGPSGAVSVNHGDDATLAITPDAHYHIVDVLVDGASVGAVASHTFSNVTADHTIEVSFAIDTRVISVIAGAHGAVAPSGAVSVNYGDDATFAITPDAHYHIVDVTVDGSSVGAVASHTFSNVTADHTIEASFAIDAHIITATAGAHGAISPSGAVSVNYGDDATFAITPDAHYHIVDVTVDGSSVGAVASHTFSNVTADHTIEATFAIDTHVITATAGTHGTIGPIGAVAINHGGDVTFAITPDTHYHVVDVLVDGTSVGAVASHTFSNVTVDHTIEAGFAIDAHIITTTAGAHGAISPSGAVSVNHGDDATFTIAPDAHYHVVDVLVDGSSVGAVASHTFSNVTADHTIEASFAIDTHLITVTVGAHGAISPSGAVSVNHGDDATFAITPDAHYHVVDVLVDGTSIGAVASHTFSSVTADHTIEASFAIDAHVITVTAGAHGAISPSGAVSVNYGDDATFAITPDAHYHIVDVLVDGSSVGAVASHTFSNVTADHTIEASFAIDTHIISVTAGAHGSTSPSGAVSVNHGDDATVTITADAHYHVVDVLVDGSSVGAVASHTFSNVTGDHTIEASFAIDAHIITATASSHGSISPSGPTSVNHGDDATFTITADAHYHIVDVTVDGISVGPVASHTFSGVTADHTIEASFAIDTHVISVAAGAHGAISPSGGVSVNHGDDATFTVAADAHYHIADVTVDGTSIGAVASHTFSNVTADHTIEASFAIDAHLITVTVGAHGAISPSGAVSVNHGDDATFAITPDAHYHIVDVLVDGSSIGAVASHTFSNVTADHTIEASFAIDAHVITVTAGAHGAISPSGAASVNHGDDATFAITADAHYHVVDVLVDGTSVGAVASHTFSNVTADHTIEASFAIDTHVITATAGAHGTISPSGALSVNHGDDATFAITADAHYHVADVLVDGTSIGAVASHTFTNVTSVHTIEVSFAIDTHTITATAGAHGSISPSGAVSINHGDDATFAITPDAHCHIVDVLVDGSSVGAVASHTFSNVTADHAIEASFAIDTHIITVTAGAHGAISPSGAVSVNHGEDATFTITADAHYHVVDVLVDGTSIGAVASHTFSSVTADHTIEASFAIDAHVITVTAGAHGAISPSGAVSVNYGDDATFAITPDAHYHIVDVLVDGSSVGAVASHTFSNVTADHTIEASFAIDTHVITATAGAHGSVSPSGPTSVNHGGDATFTIAPDAHYHIVDVTVDGTSIGAAASHTFSNVTADHTIEASFAIDAHVITATAGAHGTISPSGAVSVNHGEDATFTITADAHYHIADVLVDGTSIGAVASHTFSNVTADHTIEASFAIDTHVITATAGAHGTISPSGAVSVNHGDDATVTITPDAHYHVVDVLVDGSSVGAVASHTFSNVTADHAVVASFAIDSHVITATAGAHGSISPSGAVSVNHGADATFTITADAHYHIVDVTVDGTSIGAVASHTFSNVTADHAIAASFAIDSHIITATAGAHGTISPSGAVSANHGDDATFTITPDAHYHIADVAVDGSSVGAVAGYTFTNVTGDHAITVNFAVDIHTIAASAGVHGSISPSGPSVVADGADLVYVFSADSGYHVLDVKVDGVSQGGSSSYVFTNVTADHGIDVTFEIAFPTVGILDSLTSSSQADGSLGGSWTGGIAGLKIANHALTQTAPSSYAISNGYVFGADQEAYYQFDAVTSSAPEHDLLLKVQGTSWTAGAIQVVYSAPQGRVVVNTFAPGAGWVRRGGPWRVVFASGDQFGARALADGRVRVYRNGVVLGEATLGGWPFAAAGGRVGLMLNGASATRLIRFGGGNASTGINTPPTASILTPSTGGAYVTGYAIRVSGNGADAQDPAASLLYRWELFDASGHQLGTARTSRIDSLSVPEAGPDGGSARRVRLTVTDTGGLSGTAEVVLDPEVDLEPSLVTPVSSGTAAFFIRNLGRMPAPSFHWIVLANGAAAAQGDTLIAARDSVQIVCALPTADSHGYELRVVADTLGAIHETNESNNVTVQLWESAPFPATAILDTLGGVNGQDGSLGQSWRTSGAGFRIANHALTQTAPSSYAIWNSGVFGADQEAYYQFDAVTSSAPEHDLLLKVQGTSWTAGAIQVVYSAPQGRVVVNTFAPGAGWVRRGGPWRVVFASGDQFGARALADGRVRVYRNGVVLGEATLGGWPFAAAGGRVGLMLNGAHATRLVRFGGGNVATGHAPLAMVTPSTTTESPAWEASPRALPAEMSLSSPQPNPTVSQALVRLALPRAARVRMSVFDVSGRVVSESPDRAYSAGYWTLRWDAMGASSRALSSGLYFLRVEVDGTPMIRRVNLVR